MRLIPLHALRNLLTIVATEAFCEDRPADATPPAVPESDPNSADNTDNLDNWSDVGDNTADHCTVFTGTQLPRATAAD